MKKFVTRFGSLLVEDGQITNIFYKKEISIPRNFDFSSIVKEFMKDLAKSKPLEFIELYILLTNDDDCNEIAKEVYQCHIKKK